METRKPLCDLVYISRNQTICDYMIYDARKSTGRITYIILYELVGEYLKVFCVTCLNGVLLSLSLYTIVCHYALLPIHHGFATHQSKVESRIAALTTDFSMVWMLQPFFEEGSLSSVSVNNLIMFAEERDLESISTNRSYEA